MNGAEEAEKSLGLSRGFESTHLAFLPPGVLMRDFSPIVFILAGSMDDRWEDLSVGGRIAAKLVGNELPGWPPLVFQHLVKKRSAALLSRWRVTNISRTSASWSIALQRY